MSDVSITGSGIVIQSGEFDTSSSDGIALRVTGDAHPRVHLLPNGSVKIGDGTAAPSRVEVPGEWVDVTPPTGWFNINTLPSPEPYPNFGLRDMGYGTVKMRGVIATDPNVVAAAITTSTDGNNGSIVFDELFDAPYLPAEDHSTFTVHFLVIESFGTFANVLLAGEGRVEASGDVRIFLGSKLPDATTSMVTYLDDLAEEQSLFAIEFGGDYSL